MRLARLFSLLAAILTAFTLLAPAATAEPPFRLPDQVTDNAGALNDRQRADVQKAVAELPWVERVEARKQWPDTLRLTVYERQPFAHWGEKRLISRSGEIFEVPGAETMQGLPQLSGPDERLAEVIAFHAECMREFAGSGLSVRAVDLSARGSWRLTLASGALIEIGRVDARRRLQRFLDVWPKLAAASNGPPVYVDLRYENGFAMRWALPEAPVSSPSPGPAPAGRA